MSVRSRTDRPSPRLSFSERFFIAEATGIKLGAWGYLLLSRAEFGALSELVPLITQLCGDSQYEVLCLCEEHFRIAEAALYAIREHVEHLEWEDA